MHNPFRVRTDLATKSALRDLLKLAERTLEVNDPKEGPWYVVNDRFANYDVQYVYSIQYEIPRGTGTLSGQPLPPDIKHENSMKVCIKHDNWMKTEIYVDGCQTPLPLTNREKKKLWNLFLRGAIKHSAQPMRDHLAPAAAIAEIADWIGPEDEDN